MKIEVIIQQKEMHIELWIEKKRKKLKQVKNAVDQTSEVV